MVDSTSLRSEDPVARQRPTIDHLVLGVIASTKEPLMMNSRARK
jgi:hypothetical protein